MTDGEDAAAGEFLREFLADRDIECPGCSYNLRGLTGRTCPECGQGLVVTLRLREPRQGSLIAGLVGLSMGAGLGGLLMIYAGITYFTRPYGGAIPMSFWLVNIIGFAVHAAELGLWIRSWNTIRLLSPLVRGLLVIGCWAMPLAFIVIFSIVLT